MKNRHGKNNPNWCGGKIVSTGGYMMLRCEGHPRATKKGFYVFEHILVVEKKLGRYLKKNEVVHHINSNKQDNRISNLVVLTKSEHAKQHPPKNPFKKGIKFKESHKKRIAQAKKEYWKDWRNKNEK